jgi:hypothetical protein
LKIKEGKMHGKFLYPVIMILMPLISIVLSVVWLVDHVKESEKKIWVLIKGLVWVIPVNGAVVFLVLAPLIFEEWIANLLIWGAAPLVLLIIIVIAAREGSKEPRKYCGKGDGKVFTEDGWW